MSFKLPNHENTRKRGAENDEECIPTPSRLSHRRLYELIPMEDFGRPMSTSSERELQDSDVRSLMSYSSAIGSIVDDLVESEHDDSFQKEVADKTQKYFIGRQEAEVEVHIDRIVAKEGNKDKALLYVVSEIGNENKVQLLVNTLIHRGANPSASNTELKTALHFAVERNFRGVCSKLLEYGAYPNSKDRYTITPYTIAYDKGNDTVAAMLISYMSNKDVRHLYTSDGHIPAEFSFHKLIEKNMRDTMLAVLDCLIDHINPSGHITVYYHLLDSDENGRSPIQNGFNKNSKTPFQIIAKSGDKKLVNHDAVRLLTRRKWKEYARKRFILNSFLYLLTLLSLTVSVVVAVTTSDPIIYQTPIDKFRAVTEILTCLMVFVTLLAELNQLRKHKLEYWQDPFNYVDLSSAILILSVIPLRFLELKEQWLVLSVGFPLWTLRIFKFAAVFRQTGAFSRILWKIVRHDFLQFIVVFLVILLAFSGAFVLSLKGEDILDANDEISSFWEILFLGIRILTEAESIIEYAELKPMSCIIMLVFLFSCCVILLNILIAQLSDTYQNIQQDAQRGLEVTRAWIIARVELNTMWFGKESRITHWKGFECIPNFKEVLERWESPPLNEMKKYIQEINDSLDFHKVNLLTVRNRLARQESTLSQIQAQLELLVQLHDRNSGKRS